jgi:hypothetical protein
VQQLIFVFLAPFDPHESVQQANHLGHAALRNKVINPGHCLIPQ